MIIKERKTQGVPVLVLSGKLDMFAKNAFKEAIEKHVEAHAKRVIIDMKGVSFIDSAGLGALALAVKVFQGMKGSVIVVNPQDAVKSTLQTVNFSKYLSMFQTNEDYTTFSALT
ncbi:MAG: STAS domain-containing protein [Nitrospinae bacterium]|nr:STAS domain-containing protein [Nitrospinota bacterium]